MGALVISFLSLSRGTLASRRLCLLAELLLLVEGFLHEVLIVLTLKSLRGSDGYVVREIAERRLLSRIEDGPYLIF